MRLDKILNAVIPGMYDTPCKIAIFTNGRKINDFPMRPLGWLSPCEFAVQFV